MSIFLSNYVTSQVFEISAFNYTFTLKLKNWKRFQII